MVNPVHMVLQTLKHGIRFEVSSPTDCSLETAYLSSLQRSYCKLMFATTAITFTSCFDVDDDSCTGDFELTCDSTVTLLFTIHTVYEDVLEEIQTYSADTCIYF